MFLPLTKQKDSLFHPGIDPFASGRAEMSVFCSYLFTKFDSSYSASSQKRHDYRHSTSYLSEISARRRHGVTAT